MCISLNVELLSLNWKGLHWKSGVGGSPGEEQLCYYHTSLELGPLKNLLYFLIFSLEDKERVIWNSGCFSKNRTDQRFPLTLLLTYSLRKLPFLHQLIKREQETWGGKEECGGVHAQADLWSHLMLHPNLIGLLSLLLRRWVVSHPGTGPGYCKVPRSPQLVLGSSPDTIKTMCLRNTSSTIIMGFRDKEGNLEDEVE